MWCNMGQSLFCCASDANSATVEGSSIHPETVVTAEAETVMKRLPTFKMKTGTFLSVRDSATVICIRRRPASARPKCETLARAELRGAGAPPPPKSSAGRQDALVFGDGEVATFASPWQVLMSQREVVNYVRSTSPEELVPMRYPGEFTFPGGAVEDGETPEEAACRELTEEMPGMSVPTEAHIRLLSVCQTPPVKNRSDVIFYYVIHEDENPWLRSFSVDACNAALQARREAFGERVRDGTFWGLSMVEREAFSPEVAEVAWVDVGEALRMAYLPHANDFQAREFARLGLSKRDPIFLTLASLMEVEALPSVRSLVREAAFRDAATARAQALWLKEDLSEREVAAIVDTSIEGIYQRFTAAHYASLYLARRKDDAAEEEVESTAASTFDGSPMSPMVLEEPTENGAAKAGSKKQPKAKLGLGRGQGKVCVVQ